MLTDAEVSELQEATGALPGRRLRNLTQQQWRDLAATLRQQIRKQTGSSRPLTREAAFQFLIRANCYWEDVAGSPPKPAARQFATAVQHLRAAIDLAHASRPDLIDDRALLTEIYLRWKWEAEDMRYLVSPRKPLSGDQARQAEEEAAAMERLFGSGDDRAPAKRSRGSAGPLRGASKARHEFLGAALKLWEACGGEPKFSRSAAKKATGPLIRYLALVCALVMAKPPAPDTLAAFVAQNRWATKGSRFWGHSI